VRSGLGANLKLLLRFVQWGVLITRRSLVRNLLAVMSFAFATGILIGIGVLGAGEPATSHFAYRQFIGGDLLVIADQPVVTDLQGLQGPYSWQGVSRTNQLTTSFQPLAAEFGSLHGQSLDMTTVAEQLLLHEAVKAVYPYYALPVLLETPTGSVNAVLRGRVTNLDKELGFPDLVTEGGYLSGAIGEVLVDGFRPDYTTRSDEVYGYDRFNGMWTTIVGGRPEIIPGYPPPEVGSFIEILVPAPGRPALGVQQPDFTRLIPAKLAVTGHFQVRTGEVRWLGEALSLDGIRMYNRFPPPKQAPPDPNPWLTEPRYWSSRDLVVSVDTFRDLLAAAGWDEMRPVQQVGIILRDTSQQEVVLEELEEVIGGDVISVADLVQYDVGTPEPMYRVPRDDIARIRATTELLPTGAQRIPGWVRQFFVVMTYLLAAVTFLGNTYVLLLGRRCEVAVLQSLGTTPLLILVTFGVEALLLSMTGALFGWLALTPPLLKHWVGPLGVAAALVRVLRVGGFVLALSAATSLIFGVIPVYGIIRRSPVEGLKGA